MGRQKKKSPKLRRAPELEVDANRLLVYANGSQVSDGEKRFCGSAAASLRGF